MNVHSQLISHTDLGAADIHYLPISFITALTVLLYRLLSHDVRRAWVKLGLREPVNKGVSAEFDLLHRIQLNTLEHVVFFLPALWLCAIYCSVPLATGLGAAWVLGRAWYAVSYVKNPKKRPLGIHVAMIAALFLFIGGTGGIIYSIPINVSTLSRYLTLLLH